MIGWKDDKYNEEDNVINFKKKKYLEDILEYKLEKLRRHYKILLHWTKFSVINKLLKKKDIDKQILFLINKDKHIRISDEDLKFIEASSFKI